MLEAGADGIVMRWRSRGSGSDQGITLCPTPRIFPGDILEALERYNVLDECVSCRTTSQMRPSEFGTARKETF